MFDWIFGKQEYHGTFPLHVDCVFGGVTVYNISLYSRGNRRWTEGPAEGVKVANDTPAIRRWKAGGQLMLIHGTWN